MIDQVCRLILFNGPARSGKDTAADYLVQSKGAYAFKFSGPIKSAIKATFDLHPDEVDYVESIKDEPTIIFEGMSYRDAQISFSEDWLKPTFGQEVFGRLAARRLRNNIIQDPAQRLYVCSDSGFASEVEPLLEVFKPENVLLVRVYRDGKTFDGDSRSYIELPEVTAISLTNNGTVAQYCNAVDHIASVWLDGTEFNG